MNRKLLIVIIILILVCATAAWLIVSKTISSQGLNQEVVETEHGSESKPYKPEAVPIFPGKNYKADPELLRELSAMSPQFVEYSKHLDFDESLSPELLSIKNKLIPLVLGDRDYARSNPEANIYLYAVSSRYVVARYIAPKDTQPFPQIIDVEKGTTTVFPERIEFIEGNTAVIVPYQSIYTYTLGNPAPVLVPGSTIKDPETYDYCGGCLNSPEVVETHTSDTATVSIWDFTNAMQLESGLLQPIVVRKFEFSIPQ